MKNTIKVLIIDAHPFVTEAYEQALKLMPFKNKPLNILKAQTSDKIDNLIKNQETPIDLVLLD
ncbi:DNA-binding response regulator, partial [Wenyingzhuangia sp. chi5]|nr:DNA-binding response regulator [Wenyingzhuangia sp. chi5]MDO3696025.1 DNA-binding response regulator [Wenyingzhuangia sp. chi5]